MDPEKVSVVATDGKQLQRFWGFAQLLQEIFNEELYLCCGPSSYPLILWNLLQEESMGRGDIPAPEATVFLCSCLLDPNL